MIVDATPRRIGRIIELVRYPVKSMAGVPVQSATLGWHGLQGDRRFAFRRLGDNGGFPWLSASGLTELILYRPVGNDESTGEPLPTHVRTPDGRELGLRSEELQRMVADRLGSGVDLVNHRNGLFDDASVSVISLSTIAGIGREVGSELDRRRFRANIVVETEDTTPFVEDGWVGGSLVFDEERSGPALSVTARDVRCMMINLDPDTAKQDARVMRSVVRMNSNNAGVYGTVVQTGVLRVGQPVSLVPHSGR